jgi:hypothetical protein
MNELLFRAYDTLTKKWIAKDFTILGEVTCFDIIGQYLRANLCGKETTLARLEDVIIQQWTGRYDDTKWDELTKKERENWTVEGNMPSEWRGKKMYKGDIVKMTYTNNTIEEGELLSVVNYCSSGCYTLEIKRTIKWINFNNKPHPPELFWFSNIPQWKLKVLGNELENLKILIK